MSLLDWINPLAYVASYKIRQIRQELESRIPSYGHSNKNRQLTACDACELLKTIQDGTAQKKLIAEAKLTIKGASAKEKESMLKNLPNISQAMGRNVHEVIAILNPATLHKNIKDHK